MNHGRFWNMRRYMRARLHRKLFLAMGLAIFATMGSAIVLLHVGSDKTPWEQELEAIETFFSDRFARVWHDETQRAQLAKSAASAFHAGVELRDPSNVSLGRFGGHCHGPSWSFVVRKEGEKLGSVQACTSRGPGKKDAIIGFVGACLVLWLIAGALAKKLGKPLVQLSEVTREIGEGKLSARARLGHQHADELGDLAESINEMAERIERQMKGQRELLAAVSHEVRTPLARLRVLTEILRDRDVPEKSLRDIEFEIAEIDALIAQLLANSRLEFEALESGDVDIVGLAEVQLDRMGLKSDLLQVSGDERVLVGDATLLARAMINLIDNAEKHGGGLKRLEVQFSQREVRCVAVDEGSGFTEEERRRAFDSFFRGKSSGKSGSSLGLGLALVKRIAVAHGGNARVKNGIETGAEVSFSAKSSA